jgi:hypothetical protein
LPRRLRPPEDRPISDVAGHRAVERAAENSRCGQERCFDSLTKRSGDSLVIGQFQRAALPLDGLDLRVVAGYEFQEVLSEVRGVVEA